jgi:hypothetical protein
MRPLCASPARPHGKSPLSSVASDARDRGLPDGAARWARRTLSHLWVRAIRV